MINLVRPLVFFDLETTGVDKGNDRIVEIAMLKLYPDGSEATFTIRVNPGIPIPAEATAVHGITDDDVANSPHFYEICESVHQFLLDSDVAGFNSNNFDIPFLYNELLRAGIVWDVSDTLFVDVGNLYKIHEPRTLSEACKFYLGKELTDAHTADADTKATLRVFEAMLEKYDNLPTSLQELAVHSNFDKKRLGISGHFAYNDNNEIVFNFGKHKGRTAESQPSYLLWMMNAQFPPDTVQIACSLLDMGVANG